MKNLLLIFPILIILTFSSCFKPDDRETAYLPEEFKAYTVFNEGTWWVHEEVFSGERDSSFVFSSATEVDPSPREHFKREKNEQFMLRRRDTIYSASFPNDQTLEGIYIYIYREKNVTQNPSSMNLLIYPSDSIGQQVPIQGGAFITDIKEEIIMHNQHYYNTISVSFDGTVSENGNPLWRIRSCTFAQNVGMIRIQYYDGTIWELVDYHIEE